MDRGNPYSISAAAKRLGVERRTVSDIARLIGEELETHPTNGLAKAVYPDQLERIERALEQITVSA